jgi:endogenous inhibitor of DNA gyrase (YacG/DUF329 family)
MALTVSCPICHKPAVPETHADFPFCSERCRLTDLGNWATGRYVISEPYADQTAPHIPHPDDVDD